MLHSPWYAKLPWQTPMVCDSAIGKSTREIHCQCGARWHSYQTASMNRFLLSVKVNDRGIGLLMYFDVDNLSHFSLRLW